MHARAPLFVLALACGTAGAGALAAAGDPPPSLEAGAATDAADAGDPAGDAALPAFLAGLLAPPLSPSGPPGCVGIDTRLRLPLRAGAADGSAPAGELAFRVPGGLPGQCEPAQAWQVPATDGAARRVAMFEAGYDEPALAVTAIDGDRVGLALPGGQAWATIPAGWRFLAYPALLQDTLAYATDAWEGELCASPGEACDMETAEPGAAMQVLSTTRHAGEDWIEIEFTTPPCGEAEPRLLARGWLRAHAGDGRPAAWFHPRGC